MASRLNEDDAQGQNKWADIDDDDDDWAPEAITWGDGTKTTLPHPDELPISAPQAVADIDKSLRQSPGPGSATSAGNATSSPMTKPGGLATGRGLVLKPASQEKPSVAAKLPAPPTSAKSPWATLPPVDRASPGLNEAAQYSNDQPKDAIPTRNQPKEIAADDFRRSSWREGSSFGNRELYNSHSGRYEPVAERRGSMRQDIQTRQPSVLQRPQTLEQPGELHSGSHVGRPSQDGPSGRRRGSSSVSGGAGSAFRSGKGNDVAGPPLAEALNVRRASLTGSVDAPLSPGSASTSDPLVKGHLPQSQLASLSPGSSFAAPNLDQTHGSPGHNSVQVPVDRIVDEVEYQKKLMRERVELARKRRQEEEAREEAAKKERIQKKLEALGPAPEKKNDKREGHAVEEAPARLQIQRRDRHDHDDSSKPVSDHDLQAGTEAKSPASETTGHGAKATSPKSAHPSVPTIARRPSHGQDNRRNDPWAGPGPRPDRFSSWSPGGPPSSRNVWGSPDNDRGLGNGTFNPDLGRITNTASTPTPSQKGPTPIAPPSGKPRSASQSHAQHQLTNAGAQGARYAPGSDLASKWVASVAENDQKLSAARYTERVGRERQLLERGLAIEDAQPMIKDTWRPIHVPGDGTRQTVGTVDVQSHPSSSWKTAKEGLGRGTSALEESIAPPNAGVIGSGAPSQARSSRFFPAKDGRHDANFHAGQSRSGSPTPPPPTMEGHPVYEGDVTHPHVSLPKPQPVVKLPPAMMAAHNQQVRPSNVWQSKVTTTVRDNQRNPSSHGHARGGEIAHGNWQDRINNLLNGGRPSSSKHLGVEPSSRGPLEHAGLQTSATVSLPIAIANPYRTSDMPLMSKPMAEECFEEQEMGSLPLIRLPHNVPDAAWQRAVTQMKPLPRRFLVQASAVDPFQIAPDAAGNVNSVIILLPGMTEAKTATLPPSAVRSFKSPGSRLPPRQRGVGTSSRGAKREVSNTQNIESGHNNSNRTNRGSFRGRGSEVWNRQPTGAKSRQQSL